VTIAELRSRPLVFVDDLDDPVLNQDDHHHLTRALRIRPGDPIVVSDGNGRWRNAVLSSEPHPGEVGDIQTAEAVPAVKTIGFALVKGDRSDFAIQKLTELGIGRIIPMMTERSVVRWDRKRADKNLVRHRRIGREAAMQSRNVWLPEIWPATPLPQVFDRFPEAALAEPGASMLGSNTDGPAIREVLIGPEGGFSPSELTNRRVVGLPGNVLRTETAAITAAVLLVLTA